MKTSYVFLADGFEEIEALSTIDIMRRAGMDVRSVSINHGLKVTGAHGVAVEADMLITELPADVDAEWLIAPGGMPGASHLAECQALVGLLRSHSLNGGKIAAICAAPAVVLAPLGLLDRRTATCYPGFESQCPKAILTGNAVESHPDLITANGPSSATAFALAIVAESCGQTAADEVASGMLLK